MLTRYSRPSKGLSGSGWYLQGKANAAFEEHYAEYIGTRYCVGVANGLDALTLTYRAYMEMGIMHEGDEVIVPANTYIASILAITENGLKPVLVEPDINTLEMDDSLIEQHITSRTRSMMTRHLYGRCAYTERIGRLCKKYNLKAWWRTMHRLMDANIWARRRVRWAMLPDTVSTLPRT